MTDLHQMSDDELTGHTTREIQLRLRRVFGASARVSMGSQMKDVQDRMPVLLKTAIWRFITLRNEARGSGKHRVRDEYIQLYTTLLEVLDGKPLLVAPNAPEQRAEHNPVVFIVNKMTGLFLDVAHESHDDFAPVNVWWFGGTENQRWLLPRHYDNVHEIKAMHSWKALDADWNGGEGGTISQWNAHGGDNQKWRLILLDDGCHRIENVATGMVLDAPWPQEGVVARVHQWPWYGGDNQRWRLQLCT